MNGQNRKDIKRGVLVDIVLKEDQPTGRLTRGVVKDILTSSGVHSRGIKVRLESGQVGRVQHIVGREDNQEPSSASPQRKFACPCCGFRTLEGKQPGTFEICEVCYWEDDPLQYANQEESRGSNGVSLMQGRKNFSTFGACEERYKAAVRKPLAHEKS